MADLVACHRVLHRCLGTVLGCPYMVEQDPHMVTSRLCCRFRCSKMVSGGFYSVSCLLRSLTCLKMLWGTSSLALYIPWAGRGGPYLGISLWLWLGVLDAVQGVGLGMILLQTLSRLHVCATLAFAQIIGSICVMVARATAPNRVGPESVFPDAAKWDFEEGLKGTRVL